MEKENAKVNEHPELSTQSFSSLIVNRNYKNDYYLPKWESEAFGEIEVTMPICAKDHLS